MIVNGYEVPHIDVAFGQLEPVNQRIDERPLTEAEKADIAAVAAAVEVWEEALKEVPELYPELLKARQGDPAPDAEPTASR